LYKPLQNSTAEQIQMEIEEVLKRRKYSATRTVMFLVLIEIIILMALYIVLNSPEEKSYAKFLYQYPTSIAAGEKETKEVEVSTQVQVSDPTEVAPVQLEEEAYYDSLEELALCVEAEAGNQPLEGRQMVAAVILNRVDDTEFPNTVKEVIEQKGQFTSFWDGSMKRIGVPSEKSIQAVQLELKERKYKDLFYFRTERYSKYGTPAWKYGDHYFNTK